jgi:valyl-tRNA synthetase
MFKHESQTAVGALCRRCTARVHRFLAQSLPADQTAGFLICSNAASARLRAAGWSTIGSGYVCPRTRPAASRAPRGAVQVVVDEATYALPLAGVVDLEQERRRLDRELAKTAAQLERFDQKLANPQFLDRAPAAVIEEQRARRAEVEQARQKLAAALARIAS